MSTIDEQPTPREIVAELDRYIIGQQEAKRSVAIALRNRWRRRQVPPPLSEEIAPKNIIMIGPTGVGKTEIARRLAHLARSPFLKVEASKFTEVGYVGRDVESMIRDLVELAVNMVREEEQERVAARAAALAEERLLDLLVPPPAVSRYTGAARDQGEGAANSTREKFRQMLREGKLDDRMVDWIRAQQWDTIKNHLITTCREPIPAGVLATIRRLVLTPLDTANTE